MSRNAIVAAGLLVGAVALGTAGLSALGQSVQQPPLFNGDQVGMDRGETWEHYAQRAAVSLEEAAEGEKAWALVTFDKDTGFDEAAGAVEKLGRVGTAVYPGLSPKDLPEPTGGEGRAEVFEREAGRAEAKAATYGAEAEVHTVQSVVAYDTPAALRGVAAEDRVAAVEVLPPDAVWGAFAVRPASP